MESRALENIRRTAENLRQRAAGMEGLAAEELLSEAAGLEAQLAAFKRPAQKPTQTSTPSAH